MLNYLNPAAQLRKTQLRGVVGKPQNHERPKAMFKKLSKTVSTEQFCLVHKIGIDPAHTSPTSFISASFPTPHNRGRRKMQGFGVWVLDFGLELVTVLLSCVTLGKLLNFSELQFSHRFITVDKWDSDIYSTLYYACPLENGECIIITINPSSAGRKNSGVVSQCDTSSLLASVPTEVVTSVIRSMYVRLEVGMTNSIFFYLSSIYR